MLQCAIGHDIILLRLSWIDKFNVLERLKFSLPASMNKGSNQAIRNHVPRSLKKVHINYSLVNSKTMPSTYSSYIDRRKRPGTLKTDGRNAIYGIFEMGCSKCSGTKGEWLGIHLCRFPKKA